MHPVDANLDQSDCRIEIAQKVMCFLDDRVQVVANTGIKSEARADAPFILHKGAEGLDTDLASRVPKEQAPAPGVAGKVVLQLSARREGPIPAGAYRRLAVSVAEI